MSASGRKLVVLIIAVVAVAAAGAVGLLSAEVLMLLVPALFVVGVATFALADRRD